MLTFNGTFRDEPKYGAKVVQIFELCKFFGNYFSKKIQKFSKRKSHISHYQRFTKFINTKSYPKRKMLITWQFYKRNKRVT